MQGARQALTGRHHHLKEATMILQSQTQGLIKSHHQRLAGITEGLKRLAGLFDQGVRKDTVETIIII